MKNIKRYSIVLLAGLFLVSCNSVPKNDGNYGPAYFESSEEGYELLGISQSETAIWEDGMRTDGKEGSFEWWYTDAEFSDGTTIVVVFHTKKGLDVSLPAYPQVEIDITYPDGSTLVRDIYGEKGTVINSSKELADVRVNDSYLRYVDGNYEMYVHDGDLEYKVLMESDLAMWRPETGVAYFGENKEKEFGWFVAQPSSTITGSLKVGGEEITLEGTGYHDHNWGNVAMNEVVNNWYWGRAKVDDFDIIVSDTISTEDTGFTRLPVLMLAKDGEILDFEQSKTEVIRKDTIQHPESGKFYDNNITWINSLEDGTKYTIELIRHEDILVHHLVDEFPFVQRSIAKMVGANPTYIRSLGDVVVTIEKDGNTETFQNEGLWEQMHLGSNKEAYIWN